MRVNDLEDRVAADVAMTAHVAAHNQQALGDNRFPGWRHLIHADLLVAYGRWFAAPSHAHKSGPNRECFRNSHVVATRTKHLVYVEGRAVPEGFPLAVDHAWCVDLSTGMVIETTWPEPGRAYLGIPLVDEWRLAALETAKTWDLLLGPSPVAEPVLRNGLPREATIEIGRPFGTTPPEASQLITRRNT